MRKIATVIGLILAVILFLTGTILGSDNTDPPAADAAPLEAVGEVRGSDWQTLVSVFGCPVPHGASGGQGRVYDAKVGSLRARMLSWQGNDGLEITAVRPASAAQLLRRDDLTLDNSALWQAQGRTLLMAAGKYGACAYYGNDDAAFSFYLRGADAQQLKTVLDEPSNLTFSD